MKPDALLGIICSILVIVANLPEIVITLKRGEKVRKFSEWMLVIGVWQLIFWLVKLFTH